MELLIPEKKYYQSYIDATREYKENHVDSYDFTEIEQDQLFGRMEDFRLGRNLPENYEPGTYLWLVDHDEFVGEVSIRHRLTEPLLRFGGNIGYGVGFSQWNLGYGSIMLAKALVYASEVIGLEKVLLTCNDTNIGSARVIEKNGGVLQDKIKDIIKGKERLTRRYWIVL